jgi:cytochrome b involved in lipid metabolism
VIFNELVLDLQDYSQHHPGGKFVLEKNIGRDISKFYHGSYSMYGASDDAS